MCEITQVKIELSLAYSKSNVFIHIIEKRKNIIRNILKNLLESFCV